MLPLPVTVVLLERDTMTTASLTKESINGGWLTVSDVSPLASWWVAWQLANKHGVGELAKHSTS